MTLMLIAKATAVFAAALLAGWMLRRGSAGVRHLVYASALACTVTIVALAPFSSLAVVRIAAVDVPTISVNATGGGAAPIDWTKWAERVWIAGAALIALRFAAGAARAFWLTRTARLVDGNIYEHPSLRVPMAFGWLRPVILLPRTAREWVSARRDAVIAHEHAHIRRGDCWWAVAIEAACALFWFHPLVWVLARNARREAERAADDAVLLSGVGAADYAGHLIEIAGEAAGHWEPAAGVAMAEPSQLENRVVAVLDSSAKRTPVSRRASGLAVSAALGLTILSMGTAIAQVQAPPAGSLRFAVLDVSNARVPEALVTLDDGLRRITRDARTNPAGEAGFDGLPPGDYLINIEAKGHQTFTRGIHLGSTDGSALEVILRPATPIETVVVSGGEPARSAGAPTRIRVGGNVQSAKLILKEPPQYPTEAKVAGVQGTVFLQAIILVDGRVGSLEVLSSPSPSLSESAISAVRNWVYQPTLLNGNPIEVATRININFTLAP